MRFAEGPLTLRPFSSRSGQPARRGLASSKRVVTAALLVFGFAVDPVLAQKRSSRGDALREPSAAKYQLTSRFSVTGSDRSAAVQGRVYIQGEATYLLAFESGDLAHVDALEGKVSWWNQVVPKGAVVVSSPARPALSVGSVISDGESLLLLSRASGRLRLHAREPLVGRFGPSELEESLIAYRDWSATYSPDSAWLEKLSVRLVVRRPQIVVFLGSWCPACERFVPRLLRLADDLEAQGVEVQFVGVRPSEDDVRDEHVVAWGIRLLPTAVVLEQGRELGRLTGPDAFRRPERSLTRILSVP